MPNSAVVISTRVVTGVIGVAVAAATIAAAALLPLPSYERSPQSISVTPEPAAKQIVCPGAVLQLGNASGQNASVASAIGQPITTIAASSGSYDTTSLRQADADPDSAGAATLATAPASAENSASIAGAQYQAVDRDDYRGLAAAACAQPSSDSWLVGGSTAVGRTTLLTLANPGTVESTVAIEMFGEAGAVTAPGLAGIVIPASGQRVISLAGFAPGLASVALHVTSRGGPVVANLQQSIVRGIEPSGIDIVGTTTAPTTRTVIPGIVVVGEEALTSRLGEEGSDDLRTVLRVYVPGSTAAQATVSVIPEGGALTGASFDLVLDPGVVTDVPIEGLVDGSYSVLVQTTVPVTAAMRVSTVAASRVGATPAGASDVAWFAAASGLTDDVFASIASGAGASLHLVNPGEATATVLVGDSTVTVAAGASLTVAVEPGESVRISGARGVVASVSFASAGNLASYVLNPAANSAEPVTVFPG